MRGLDSKTPSGPARTPGPVIWTEAREAKLDPRQIDAPARPRPDITRAPRDLPSVENQGLRPPTTGFWAVNAMRVGLKKPEGTQATRAALWATELGRVGPTQGAELRDDALAQMPIGLTRSIRRLSSKFERIGELERLFAGHSVFVGQVDVALGLGAVPGVMSLRELVNKTYPGRRDRQDALRRMDTHLAQARRYGDEPIHDLHSNPSGLKGPSGDGALPHTIDKVLLVRRLGRLSKADLACRHEVVGNNRAQVYSGGREAYPAILEAVRRARSSVHVSYFIFKDGECGEAFARALKERARAGVRVRVNLDQAGAMLAGAKNLTALMRDLRGAGVEVVCNRVASMKRQIRPLNSPDHRKQVIVDGRIGFTGGLNMGDEYVYDWHDAVIGVEGDVVHQMQADWMLNWMALHGELDPGLGDDAFRRTYFPPQPEVGRVRFKLAQAIPGHNPEIRRGLLELIEEAHDELLITTPYVTSVVVQEALLRAAERGVQVKLLIPGENNHAYCDLAARTVFGRMLDAGIQIFEYPGMNHGKVMVVDRERTSFGTSNLDDLSLRTIYEMNLNSDDPGFAQQVIARVFEPDLAKSRRLDKSDLRPGQIAAGKVWKVFTPLL